MSFNISSFKENINVYGYLTSNKFEVYLRPPEILLNDTIRNFNDEVLVSDIIDLLRFRVEDVKAPGIGLLTADVARYGLGPTQKMPFNAQFNEITLTMLCDRGGFLWRFWHNWVRGIFQFNGTESFGNGTNSNPPTYTTEYKDNYATTMQIIIYDQYGEEVNTLNLFESFPTGIRDTQLDWSDNNNLLRLNVNISFNEFLLAGNS